MSLRVSVVICTFNRAHLLPRLIDRVAVELHEHDGEIVVVDNASSDGTRAVLADAAARHSRLKVVDEPHPGLSYARNAGVRESSGDVVVFLDDDALPAPQWLKEHLAAYEGGNDALGAVGGRIELLFEPDPRPRWLSHRFDTMLGRYDLGDEPRPYDDGLATPPGGVVSRRLRGRGVVALQSPCNPKPQQSASDGDTTRHRPPREPASENGRAHETT